MIEILHWLWLRHRMFLCGVLIVGTSLCALAAITIAMAREQFPGQYAQADSPYAGWAGKQMLTARSRVRFSCNPPPADCSCCHNADIVQTKFRVAEDTSDAWDWFNPQAQEWQRVPEDVIHWDEKTPDQQAVIFVNGGRVLCFFPPQGGGG